MARILYVEADPQRARAVLALLHEHDHCVDAVRSAERAMIRLDGGERYDALLLDLYLLGMDGAELCRWVEKSEALSGMRKLVFTWRGQPSPVNQGESLPRWLPAHLFVADLARPEDLVDALEWVLPEG